MSGMLIVFKPIKFEDLTLQNRKLKDRLKFFVGPERKQKNEKGKILLKMMLK